MLYFLEEKNLLKVKSMKNRFNNHKNPTNNPNLKKAAQELRKIIIRKAVIL